MKKSSLFTYIETLQADVPWGSLLDAGTGTHSMGWLLSLPTERWTAVSGSPAHAAQVKTLAADRVRTQDRLLVGNWVDRNRALPRRLPDARRRDALS